MHRRNRTYYSRVENTKEAKYKKKGSVIKLFRKGSQISGLDDLAAPRLMLIYAFNWLTRHDRNGSRVCL